MISVLCTFDIDYCNFSVSVFMTVVYFELVLLI